MADPAPAAPVHADTPSKGGGLGSGKVLKKMDVFTKVHDDFRVRSWGFCSEQRGTAR